MPTAVYWAAFGDDREQCTDTRSYVDLKYEHNFSPDQKLMSRAFYDVYLYRGDYPSLGGFDNYPPTYMNKDDHEG